MDMTTQLLIGSFFFVGLFLGMLFGIAAAKWDIL
jgi:hypothetical protein